ncbi:MAG: hypothetical protein K6G65_02500 [Lachnospiraceae bacterium]|nr:hypothetical protein [Lachnospiraceae bacterium]
MKLNAYIVSVTLKLYRWLIKIPVLKGFLKELVRRNELLVPVSSERNVINSMSIFLKSISVLAVIMVISILFFSPTMYSAFLLVIFLYLIFEITVEKGVVDLETKLLGQLESFISEIRYYYNQGSLLSEAIFDALEDAPCEVAAHVNIIYEVITEEDEEKAFRYRETAPNKFFRTFLALCEITTKYGDFNQKEESVLLRNLNLLKKEIKTELLKRKNADHLFSGLLFLVLFPVFFLRLIEMWGTYNVPELSKYYQGAYGFVVTILICLSTLVIQRVIVWLKNISMLKRKKHRLLGRIAGFSVCKRAVEKWMDHHIQKAHQLDKRLKRCGEGYTIDQFLILRICYLIGGFVFSIFLMSGITHLQKRAQVTQWQQLQKTQVVISGKITLEEATDVAAEVTRLLVRLPEEKAKLYVDKMLARRLLELTEEERESIAEQIQIQIHSYKRITFAWYYLILAILVAGIAYFIPSWSLGIKTYYLEKGMEDEVLGFHSIILMLMSFPRMSTEVILEWLSNYAEIFKASLEECSDSFSMDNEEAIRRLKEQEPYPPFLRIAESFKVADRIGIKNAFREMEFEREYLFEKRKQDNEINLKNRSTIGKTLAFLPLLLTICLYLIVPFVLASMEQLSVYLGSAGAI